MLGEFRNPRDHRSPFAICYYVEEPRTWIPGELVTSGMMNTIRDLFLEIEAGTAQMIKATLVGDTSANLASLISDSGEAAIAYDTTLGQLVASINGAAFLPLGGGLRQTFRGLTLRTHPNADVAASKVYLDHADEITMNDGTRVADWDDLVADITASGAGGLDTGAEQASTWYPIYAIRKSSDGTKNLLLHRAKNHLQDVAYTTTGANRALRLSTSTASDKLAQGVTVITPGVVPFIDVLIAKVGAPTGHIWLTIESDSGGNPSGTPLATSDKMEAAALSTTNFVWARFVFRTPVTLTAALHHIVLQGDYTKSDTVHVIWAGSAADGYAGGSGKQYNGTSWSAATGVADFDFRTYVIQNDTAVTLPTGYDQYCLVGWVYNDSGSNFAPFLQNDRTVALKQTLLSSGMSNTYLTQIDLSSLVPPIPVVVDHWTITIDSAGQIAYVYPTLSAAAFGIIFFHVPAASYYSDLAVPVLVDFQHCYIKVGGGNGTFYALGFTW